MKTNQQQELKERLATLNGRERKELTRRAAESRARAQRTVGSPESRWSIEQWMLHLSSESPEAAEAIVIASSGKRCRVVQEGQSVELELHRDCPPVVPGDRVRVEAGRVRAVCPRATSLERSDPSRRGGKLTIVANIDCVVIVVSCVSPPLHPRLIDRYLAAIWKGGAEPAVVLNKVDLHERPEDLADDRALLQPYREMGIPVAETSASLGSGWPELRAILQGKLAVLVGHSGVGKSSLLNAILNVGAQTGDVSSGSYKGRHTTTGSSLHERDGIRLIDTPGVREFGVTFDSAADLASCFREFPAGCRYADCDHTKEEGCAVLAAVHAGAISPARYESYRRLLLDVP